MKEHIQNILLNMTRDKDIIITIERYGDSFTFHNYETDNIIMDDEYFMFRKEGKTVYRTRYSNIKNLKWRPVFPDKNITMITDAEYNEKQ